MNKDVEPDVFFYNFAGYSGKFYSKKGANIKGHGENLFELSDPEAHLLIRLKNSKNNPIFEIIAPGNIKYTFKAIEITKRHALGFFDRSVDLECPISLHNTIYRTHLISIRNIPLHPGI